MKLDNTKSMEEKVTEIIEGVFLHGKETPHLSYGLPKGQMTEADAIKKLYALLQEAKAEERKRSKRAYCEVCRCFIDADTGEREPHKGY